MARHRVLGISFDHMHMGDLLRQVSEHPDAEIAGIFDPDRSADGSRRSPAFGIPEDRVFTDLDACLAVGADLAIVCSATARHAETVEAIAPTGISVMVEKPFAASAAEARRMIAAMEGRGRLAVNWPLAWYPSHNTAKRLVDEGAIGELIEVHFYDGNRGPLFHLADKVEVSPEEVERQKPRLLVVQAGVAAAAACSTISATAPRSAPGSTAAQAPLEVTSVVDETPGIEVDQHSITVARYAAASRSSRPAGAR